MVKNILIMVAIGGFLHLGGYPSIARIAIGIAILGGLISLFKGKKSKSKDKESDSKKDYLMDPIEIETTRKPDYQIPSNMVMKVSPNKKPSQPKYVTAVGKISSPLTKYIGKKLKD